jgi:hypothetical protein
MAQRRFPPLPLAEWRDTRDTIHHYSQVLGAVRRSLMPPQKHWWHISLRAAAVGLTTTPIPAGGMTFEMLLDLTTHELGISTSEGDWWDMSLRGQSVHQFYRDTLEALRTLGIQIEIDSKKFEDRERRTYDTIAVEDYWQALSQIDILLKQFKGELRQETSPVQLWPHHFDLSLVWFSGRLVPGQDPNDPENADEQMGFGFSTGDEGIREPYFYVTAYPWPEGLEATELPPGAYWNTDGWNGAVLPYAELVGAPDADNKLLGFWRAAHGAGAARMQPSGGAR